MHSIDHYDTLRRGREELLHQAEQERMARAALLKRKTNWTVRLALIRLTNAGSCPSRQRDCVATAARSAETKGTTRLVLRTQVRRKEKVANWLGIHLVRWGKKLERFGTLAEA